ncbi:MAG: hypothetical protein JWL86_2116 [Rhizobium sp.]|nr:hypothetical protein [Rhizobium sp.]
MIILAGPFSMTAPMLIDFVKFSVVLFFMASDVGAAASTWSRCANCGYSPYVSGHAKLGTAGARQDLVLPPMYGSTASVITATSLLN